MSAPVPPTADEVIEAIRLRLIESRIGLITDDDLVQWADEWIDALDDPPHELISVSLGESLPVMGRLDLLVERIRFADWRSLASTIVQRWDSGHIAFDDVVHVISNFETLYIGYGDDSDSAMESVQSVMTPIRCAYDEVVDTDSVIDGIRSRLREIADGGQEASGS